MTSKRFYITTAIDYPNGHPHLGHAYEKIITDFYARYYRLKGYDVFFLTGTDENGQKLKKSAQEASVHVMDFVDRNVEVFQDLCLRLELTHDDFIRTTQLRHKQCSQNFWAKLLSLGLIYKGEYSGYYCLDCETFYTQAQLIEGKCPAHHKELPVVKEVGYFFKLSQFQDFLLSMIQANPNFIVPSKSRKEILSRLQGDELRDLSISRKNEGWGIEIPNDPDYVMYTWFDALINYYSALDNDFKQSYWPASVHVIGKDITWFHTVIWPAILKAMDLPLPYQVYVHGMVLAEDGRKMSKSLGNGVDPFVMMDKYPLDSFKFYILSSIPAHSDGSFSEQELIDRHNSTLANDFGNLVMRAVKLTLKKIGPTCQGQSEFRCAFDFELLEKEFHGFVERFEHNKAIDRLWEEIYKTNQYINNSEPWKIKEDTLELRNILYNCLFALHSFAYYLTPVMPQISQKIYNVLGLTPNQNPIGQFGIEHYHLTEPEILFVKIEH